MPFLDQATRWATNKMPSVIGSRAHAIIDYAMAASFFGMAVVFWGRREKRAALCSLGCGAAETTLAMLTDYPGGLTDAISFETHGSIDFGLTGLIASLPNMMRFSDQPESRFFHMQGMAMAAVTGLTDFTGTGERSQMDRVDERAA